MTSRLLCVGFATSLDRYAWLGSLRVGEVNRPTRIIEVAGGKAFNVSRSSARLGIDVHTIALVGGPGGSAVRALAERDGISTTFVHGFADTRQSQCLLDQASGEVTEFYEPVRAGTAQDVDGMCLAVEAALRNLSSGDLLALSGRLAPGHDDDSMARLVTAAQRAGVPVVVDSDGRALRLALRAGPELVKVNRVEAARAADLSADTEAEYLARALEGLGAAAAVVTDGVGGAVASSGSASAALAPPPIVRACPVGSGDAFLAGIVAGAFDRGCPRGALVDMLIDGVAAARVNARSFMAGSIDRTRWLTEREYLTV